VFLHRSARKAADSLIVTRSVLAAVLVLAPTLAAAAPYDVVVGDDTGAGFVIARQEVPTPPPTGARALSRIIYLNRHGVTITPGSSDARINRSSVASQPTTIPGWAPPADVWADTVACLEGMFAPFDVVLTEIDPGAAPHVEAVFGGTPNLLGLSSRIAGVAPLSQSCGVVENAMVFTFAEILVQEGQVVCETAAQEIAHAYGLDHELLPADPMSYLRHAGERTFQNEMASCGEATPRPCGLGPTSCRPEQNSYALLLERLGPTTAEPTEGSIKPAIAPTDDAPTEVGCSTGGPGAGLAIGLAALLARGRRRATAPASRR